MFSAADTPYDAGPTPAESAALVEGVAEGNGDATGASALGALKINNLRRSSFSSGSLVPSCAAVVVDADTARGASTAAALGAAATAASFGGSVAVYSVARVADAQPILERLTPKVRLVLVAPRPPPRSRTPSASSLGSDASGAAALPAPRGEAPPTVSALARAAAAGAVPPPAVVALNDGDDDGAARARGAIAAPLGRVAANELLWRHLLPFGPVQVSAARPIGALRRDLGAGALTSLRAGGPRPRGIPTDSGYGSTVSVPERDFDNSLSGRRGTTGSLQTGRSRRNRGKRVRCDEWCENFEEFEGVPQNQ